MFRRPTIRYGQTPEPVTPYQRAAQVWDDRIGSARVQARNWRLMAFGCLILSAVFVGAATDALFDEIKWFLIVWTLGIEVGILFLLTLQRNYNRQVEVKEQAAKAWSLIDVSLQRRSELLPNLVEVVKGYAAHERETLDAVIQARNMAQSATGPAEAAAADNMLTGLRLAKNFPGTGESDFACQQLGREFPGKLGTVAYHAACHLRAQKIGFPGARVLGKIQDTDVRVIEECSAVDGTWGMKAAYYETGRKYAQRLVRGVEGAEPDHDVEAILSVSTHSINASSTCRDRP